MKFHPIDDPQFFKNRDFIGEHWNRKFIRAIQAVLNATKGKVGRGKEFFEEAFGKDIDEFTKILWMPETFIIYRRRYDASLRSRLAERYKNHYPDENNLVADWWSKFNALAPRHKALVKNIVSNNSFPDEILEGLCAPVLDVLEYYRIKRND